MATNLGLDDEVAGVEGIADNATGWASRVQTALRNAFHSTVNPFGTAAQVDTGTAAGEIPVLGVNGILSRDRIPVGTGEGDIPVLAASGLLDRARLPAATEAAAGATEYSTSAEAIAGTQTERAVTPAALAAALAAANIPQVNFIRKSKTNSQTIGTTSTLLTTTSEYTNDAEYAAIADAADFIRVWFLTTDAADDMLGTAEGPVPTGLTERLYGGIRTRSGVNNEILGIYIRRDATTNGRIRIRVLSTSLVFYSAAWIRYP